MDHARKSAAQAVKAAMGLKPEPYQCPPVGHERIHGGDVTTRYAIYIYIDDYRCIKSSWSRDSRDKMECSKRFPL